MPPIRIYQTRRSPRKKDSDIISGGLPGLFRYRGHATGITQAPTLYARCRLCGTWYGRYGSEGRSFPRDADGSWLACTGMRSLKKFISDGEPCGAIDYEIFRSFDFEAMPIGRITLPKKEIIKAEDALL